MIWWPEEVPTLKSDSLTMRPMRPSDAEDIYRAVQDPEIPKFTTVPADYPIDLAIEFANTRAAASFVNKTELVFVIEDARLATATYPYSNGFAGVMSLHTIEIPNHRAEIGYWLAKEARGHGICTKAAELITEYGLMTIGFKRIDGIVDVRNEPSKAALLKAGYEFEGIMKSYVTRRDGSQLDMALFAATKP
ncbi:MAG: GNAT family N-acetyltransferase [Candidatus Nanopelagicaceae bacterium]|nr:GNAT family N-acetyltransferase [Candidatus Nanopelagicaceae bacterium]